jgi:hypothetical protein
VLEHSSILGNKCNLVAAILVGDRRSIASHELQQHLSKPITLRYFIYGRKACLVGGGILGPLGTCWVSTPSYKRKVTTLIRVLTLRSFPVIRVQRDCERDPEIHHHRTDISCGLISFRGNLTKDEGNLSGMKDCKPISEQERDKENFKQLPPSAGTGCGCVKW